MKRPLLALIGASAFAVCGSALAADNTLETIVVHGSNQSVDCTPPSSVPGCAALHAKIRANFSPREIQLLFGARTATPEGMNAYPGLADRYAAFMRNVDVAALSNSAATAK